MSLVSHCSADIFLHIPATPPPPPPPPPQPEAHHHHHAATAAHRRRRRKRTILFFIPGNPGLIGYYYDFLSLLCEAESLSEFRCIVAGFSLGGFDVDVDVDSTSSPSSAEAALLRRIQYPAGSSSASASASPDGSGTYSLQEQIALTDARVGTLVDALRHGSLSSSQLGKGQTEDDGEPTHEYEVILLGHSIGAYIALEVVRLLQLRNASRGLEKADQRPTPAHSYVISGAILLTPTIVDLALSRRGRLVAPILGIAPFALTLETLVAWTAWGLSRMFSRNMLEGLVQRVTGWRAGEKLRSTVAWLLSKKGVSQTVRMAREEMLEVCEDRWTEETWGIAGKEMAREEEGEGEEGGGGGLVKGEGRMLQVVLYFAREDHWVDDATRDAIVKARGATTKTGDAELAAWPRIEIEERGKLVHAWCIEQSREVAEKVQGWIEEMMEG